MTSDSKQIADQMTETDQLQLVTFRVGEEEFGVDILAVQDINRMLPITHVPEAPKDVVGVVNLRGRIIPVVDLRSRFGMESREANNDSRIVVVNLEEHILGFIVDRVNEVLRIDRGIVDPAPASATTVSREYIQGIGKLDDRLLILLDLSKLFSEGQAESLKDLTGPQAKAA